MDYVALAMLAFEIIKWLDANKQKKVNMKQVKTIASAVGKGRQITKVEQKGLLPDLVWAINRLRKIK